MKVAITAKGVDLTSEVDPRFGRAPYIIIVDTQTMAFEVIDNSTNVQAFKGAGIQAAAMIHDRGAEVLMTGYCGPRAFQTLQAAGIKIVSEVSGNIAEALTRLESADIAYLQNANAEAHW